VIILALQFSAGASACTASCCGCRRSSRPAANVDIVQAGWLASVPYLAAVMAMVGVSWASDRLQKRKRFVWPPLLIASIAFYGSYALGANISGGRTRCW
jgi:hypothetical protein